MMYPYQIKTQEQYHKEYARSVEDPEAFWSQIADHFVWKKKVGSRTRLEFHGTACQLVQWSAA
jgi:acetyl-CoA synthetase